MTTRTTGTDDRCACAGPDRCMLVGECWGIEMLAAGKRWPVRVCRKGACPRHARQAPGTRWFLCSGEDLGTLAMQRPVAATSGSCHCVDTVAGLCQHLLCEQSSSGTRITCDAVILDCVGRSACVEQKVQRAAVLFLGRVCKLCVPVLRLPLAARRRAFSLAMWAAEAHRRCSFVCMSSSGASLP